MTTDGLVKTLDVLGVTARVDCRTGRLMVGGEVAMLTDALRGEIAAHKPRLLFLFATDPIVCDRCGGLVYSADEVATVCERQPCQFRKSTAAPDRNDPA